jgi:hypothetical protein
MMKNELFDKFFGPPINIPKMPAKKEGVNYLLIGLGGIMLGFLLNKAYLKSQKEEQVKSL